MNILIPTIGSRGDVQPFIALGYPLERSWPAVGKTSGIWPGR